MSRNIREASIDHVNPTLYKDAAKVNRILRNAPKGKGHVRVGRDSVKVERLPKQAGLLGTVKNKLSRAVLKSGGVNPDDFAWSDKTPHGEALTRGSSKPRSKRGKHFNVGGIVAAHPRKFKDNAVHLTHELLHIKDPGRMDRHDVPYKRRRQERHAFGGASILGVRALKKAGVSRRLATTGLRIGSMKATAHHKLVVQPSSNAVGKAVREKLYGRELNRHYDNFAGVDSYLQGAGGKRPKQKMAKEVWKGIERVYGARNKSGGTVNKFGHVKLARPIGKLPESREELIQLILEAYGEHSIQVNKYGQTNVHQADRGKPGDYKFWEKHRAQQNPVVRPKDPPKIQVHRAKVVEPKPSTARDRALAWRKKNMGESANSDSVARIRAKLNPVKKVDHIQRLTKKLSPVTLVRGSKGQVINRFREGPHALAREVVTKEPNNPHLATWNRLGKAQSNRAMRPRLSPSTIQVNKQQVYDRVSQLGLSPTKKNMKDVFLGRQ